MTKIIGLTGGIATGKSTVSNMFVQAEISVIDTDDIAKSLLDSHQEAYKQIINLLGEDILSTDKTINRNKLAKKIFSDETIRNQINAIIHPKVKEIVHLEITRLKAYEPKFIVLDVPLLFESGMNQICDITILVYARKSNQIERLMRRDHIDENYAKQKISAQWSLTKKKALADFVIDNSDSVLKTKIAFEKLLRTLKGESI